MENRDDRINELIDTILIDADDVALEIVETILNGTVID